MRLDKVVVAAALSFMLLVPAQLATSSLPPLERAAVSDLMILDQNGQSIKEIAIGTRVLITGTVANAQAENQPFLFIIQVKDADGVTILLTWLPSELSALQSFDAVRPWVPEKAGEYRIEVFLWDGIDSPLPLSPVLSRVLTVGVEQPEANVVALKVIDKKTKMPLAGTIMLIANRAGKIVDGEATDGNGEVKLLVQNGEYVIIVQANSYDKRTESLQIDQDVQKTFELTQCSGPYGCLFQRA